MSAGTKPVVTVRGRDDVPRIYVACLAAYNNGKLHGAWLEVTEDRGELLVGVQDMLDASPEPGAEEWAIHDAEGFWDIRVGENPSLEWLTEVAALISEHGELGAKLMAHLNQSPAATATYLDENYQGAWDSLEAWGEQYLEDTGGLSGLGHELRCYFDFESFAEDCETNGDIFTVETDDGEVHVFSNR